MKRERDSKGRRLLTTRETFLAAVLVGIMSAMVVWIIIPQSFQAYRSGQQRQYRGNLYAQAEKAWHTELRLVP
jgi:hypothetical protein